MGFGFWSESEEDNGVWEIKVGFHWIVCSSTEFLDEQYPKIHKGTKKKRWFALEDEVLLEGLRYLQLRLSKRSAIGLFKNRGFKDPFFPDFLTPKSCGPTYRQTSNIRARNPFECSQLCTNRKKSHLNPKPKLTGVFAVEIQLAK